MHSAANVPDLLQLNNAVSMMGQQLRLMYLQLTRVRQRTYALHAEARLRAAGEKPRMPIEFTSQFGEDLLIYDLFDGKREGFFIEAGAFDGYRYSVTYALEALGWNGLLVEAIPEAFERCRQRRPHSRVVHAALSRPNAGNETEFTVVHDIYGGMLSYHLPTAEHQSALVGTPRTVVRVPLTTLNELLADHHGAIDLLSLDVEDAELDVLQGFDLNRHRPKVILLEEDFYDTTRVKQRYMAQFPYKPVARVEASQVYIRSDLTDLLERVVWLHRF
jgi:FkbM family methyltransferase